MAICTKCNEQFDLATVKRSIDRIYDAGTYDRYCIEGELCENCAENEISMFYCLRAELRTLIDADNSKNK